MSGGCLTEMDDDSRGCVMTRIENKKGADEKEDRFSSASFLCWNLLGFLLQKASKEKWISDQNPENGEKISDKAGKKRGADERF